MYKKPIYVKIYQDLRGKITSGRFLPGEQLPSENNLRNKFSVSRQTVQHVFALLTNEGLVYRRQGLGTFVAHYAKGADANLDDIVIRLGGINYPKTPLTQFHFKFARRVAELTRNRIKVEVFHSSNLGSGMEQLKQIADGKLDMFGAAVDWLAQLEPAWGITNFPFLFRDLEHLKKYIGSPINKALKNQLLEHLGVRVISDNWLRPSRVIISRKPCFEVENFKRIRLRIPPIPIYSKAWEVFDAVPVEATANVVRDLLDLGRIDAADMPRNAIYEMAAHRSAPFCTYTRHVYSRACLIMSEKRFQNLRADLQHAIVQAGKEIGELYSSSVLDMFLADKEKMISEGARFIETDIEPFKQLVKPLARKIDQSGEWSPGLYEEIQKL